MSGVGGAGVKGENDAGAAVLGVSAPTLAGQPVGVGVRGLALDPDNQGFQGVGVEGISAHGIGVAGTANGTETGAIGVQGIADDLIGIGVRGRSSLGIGVVATSGDGVGLTAHSSADSALEAQSNRARAGCSSRVRRRRPPLASWRARGGSRRCGWYRRSSRSCRQRGGWGTSTRMWRGSSEGGAPG